MGDGGSDYEFGSADDELARLEVQGSVLAPATRMIFAAAGIRTSMRVLDLVCGAEMWLSWRPTWLGLRVTSSASIARRKP